MLHHKDFHKSTHSLFLKHKWNPEIVEYYIYKVMRNISFALVSLFVPIYLFSELGYSLFQIMLFYLINEVLYMIAIPFSGKVIEKLGIKHSILVHLPGMAIYIYCLRFLSENFYSDLWIIVILLMIRNFPKSLMTSAEQVFVAKNILNQKGHDGSGLASIRIVLILATLISPLIGGFITYFFGFEMFFNVAIGFMVLAMIPLLLTKDQYFHSTLSSGGILNFVFKSVPRNFHIAEGARWTVDSLLWIIWPLFLFIVVENTLDMGILVSISSVISIVVSYFVGKKIDSSSPKKLLKKMTKISASLFFMRSVFPNQVLIILFDSISKILDPVLLLPYEKYFYKYIKSNEDILKISIASNFILEFYYFLSMIFLTMYFGTLEYLNVEISYLVFIGLFMVYGSLILFMTKISDLVEEEEEE